MISQVSHLYWHRGGKAHAWLNLAATDHPQRKWREKAAQQRDGLAVRMTPEQLAEAQKLAAELDKRIQGAMRKKWEIKGRSSPSHFR